MEKDSKEKCKSEYYQLSLKYFIKSYFIQKLSSKVSKKGTNISGGTLIHE